MEVDCPYAKRRKTVGLWWEAPEILNEDVSALLWGLCDALTLYASGVGHIGGSVPEDAVSAAPARFPHGASSGQGRFGGPPTTFCCPPGSPDSASSDSTSSGGCATLVPSLGTLGGCGGLRFCSSGGSGGAAGNALQGQSPACSRRQPLGQLGYHGGSCASNGSCIAGGVGHGCSSLSLGGLGGAGGGAAGTASRQRGVEALLRTLTQLANAAAAGAAARRHLVSECQVHAPLLRLMQGHWAQLAHVAERCCRLLHWLCAGNPENRDIVAAHRSPCALGGTRLFSFVDAALSIAEAHSSCRDVIAHVLRALAVLLPCPCVREELLRSQQRLLACLACAGGAADAAVLRAVRRWLPCLAGQLRGQGRGTGGREDTHGGAACGGSLATVGPVVFGHTGRLGGCAKAVGVESGSGDGCEDDDDDVEMAEL